ncbi:MAG TPA: hypothetical protein VEK07_17515 [Polyangiaceae bacterium]|nr:hypothetical protein [Polyangiaceae bacterium]
MDERTGLRSLGARCAHLAVLALAGGVTMSSACNVARRDHGASSPDPRSSTYVWRNVAVLGGGFVTGIVFNPSERGLVYLRTDIGGAYRWQPDAGAWTPLLDWVTPPDWNLHGVESLASDPTEPRRVYLAAGTYTNPDVSDGEILRSADYGRTWERTRLPFKMGGNEAGRGNGERLAVDPRESRILYFGSRRDGLWRSADFGVAWQRVESFPSFVDGSAAVAPTPGKFNYLSQAVGIVFVRFDPRGGRPGEPTRTLYVAASTANESLFRTLDGGTTWHAVPGQPLGLRPNRCALGSDGALFVTYGDEPGPNRMQDGAVFKLDTGSGVWTNVTPEKPTRGGRRFGYAAVAVDAHDPAIVVVTTWHRDQPFDEIFRSRDGGATWSALLERAQWDHSAAPYTATMRHHWMSDVEIDPFDPNHVLFTTGYGIWATHNAKDADSGAPTRWSFEDRGLEETVPLALASPPEGAHLISGLGDIDGFRHDDLTKSPAQGRFEGPRYKNTEWLDFAGRAPALLVRTGTTYGGDQIVGSYSRDGGSHWTSFPSEPPRPTGSRPFGTGPIAISSDGKVIAWTTDGNPPYATRDNGNTWQAVEGAPVGLRLVADRVDPDAFYGFSGTEGVLYASRNGGATVRVLRGGFPVSTQHRRYRDPDLRAVPDRPGELWLASGGVLFRLRAGSQNVVRIDSATEVSSIGFGKPAVAGAYPAIFVTGRVAGAYGVFRSDDEAASFVRLTDDAHQFARPSHVTGDPRIFGRVYFATDGRGIVYGDITP